MAYVVLWHSRTNGDERLVDVIVDTPMPPPCPMCLSALYWAGIERICYANTKRDAAAIEFDDSFIYDQLRLDYDRRSIHCEHFMRNEAMVAFDKWQGKTDKVEY